MRLSPRRRTVLGLVAGAGAVLAITLVLLPLRDNVDAATPTAVMVLAVLLAAVVGGVVAAVATAVLAGLALNLTFLDPYGTLKVRAVEDGIGLVAFVVAALVVGVLVSSIVEARRAVERRNEQLAALVEERQRLLAQEQRAEALAHLDDERTALLRSVSHDLRTPLSAIRAIAGDLRDGVVYDDETRREVLGIVVDEADRLDRFVSDLLSMSRIEAGMNEPQLAAVDVAEVVEQRLRGLSALLAPFDVHVRVPPELPLVAADEVQLEQVLTNLLANATRHSPKGSDLWVVAERDDDRGRDMVRVEVSDRGSGIPSEDRDRVFLPFERGPGSRSSGVGLAICKAIIDAHHGRIWIADRFGGGTTIAFTVPVIALPPDEATS